MVSIADTMLSHIASRKIKDAGFQLSAKEQNLRQAERAFDTAKQDVVSAQQDVSKASQTLSLLKTIDNLSKTPDVVAKKLNFLNTNTTLGLNVDTYA